MGSVTDASGTAVTCDNCNASLGPDSPVVVWYQGRKGDLSYSVGYVPVRGCLACADDAYNDEHKRRGFTLNAALRRFRGEQPHVRYTWCEGCQRRMLFVTDTKYVTKHDDDEEASFYPRAAYCSDACRNQRTARAREKVCEVCGEEFTATRRDAKTCSAACKQKAYRRRRTRPE